MKEVLSVFTFGIGALCFVVFVTVFKPTAVRAVDGTSARFGSNMVLGFNQSSTTIDVQIAMVSKFGAAPQSAPVLVKTSPGPNVDAYCFSSGRGACRWGDYSSASPDPTPGTTHTGRVWLTNEWNVASTDDNDIDWRTWNWAAAPHAPGSKE